MVGSDIPVPDDIIGSKRGKLEPLLALAKPFLGQLPVGDIHRHASNAGDVARLVVDDNQMDLDPDRPSVAGDPAELASVDRLR